MVNGEYYNTIMKISPSFIPKAVKDEKSVQHYMPSKVSVYLLEMNLDK